MSGQSGIHIQRGMSAEFHGQGVEPALAAGLSEALGYEPTDPLNGAVVAILPKAIVRGDGAEATEQAYLNAEGLIHGNKGRTNGTTAEQREQEARKQQADTNILVMATETITLTINGQEMNFNRDDMQEHLETMLAGEEDAQRRETLEAALEALENGDDEAFQALVTENPWLAAEIDKLDEEQTIEQRHETATNLDLDAGQTSQLREETAVDLETDVAQDIESIETEANVFAAMMGSANPERTTNSGLSASEDIEQAQLSSQDAFNSASNGELSEPIEMAQNATFQKTTTMSLTG